MKRSTLHTILSVLLLAATAFPATAATDTNGFRVGLATADITPPAGWRRAGAYTEFLSQPGGDLPGQRSRLLHPHPARL